MADFQEKKTYDEELAQTATHQAGEFQDLEKYATTDGTHDAVFGQITEGDPNYRNVGQNVLWHPTCDANMRNRSAGWVLSL